MMTEAEKPSEPEETGWQSCQFCKHLSSNQPNQDLAAHKKPENPAHFLDHLEELELEDTPGQIDRKLSRCPDCRTHYISWMEKDSAGFMGEVYYYFFRLDREQTVRELLMAGSDEAMQWMDDLMGKTGAT